MNASLSSDTLDQISAALYARRKIEAVRLYRETARVGLADAKREVEKLEVELRKACPEKFDPFAGWSKSRVALILAMHCLMVTGLLIVNLIMITEFMRGVPQTTLKMIMLPFALACSIGGAVSAFRAQWYKLWKP